MGTFITGGLSLGLTPYCSFKTTWFTKKCKRLIENILLDDKLKIKNAETLTFIEIKKDKIIQCSVPLYSKTIVHYKFPCFEGPYCSEHI